MDLTDASVIVDFGNRETVANKHTSRPRINSEAIEGHKHPHNFNSENGCKINEIWLQLFTWNVTLTAWLLPIK
jgi:hypothetical protein